MTPSITVVTLAIVFFFNKISQPAGAGLRPFGVTVLRVLNFLPLVLGGLITLFPSRFNEWSSLPFITDWHLLGVTLAGIGLVGTAVYLPPLRTLLEKLPSFDTNSPVHWLAISMALALILNSLITLTQGGLEQLAEVAVVATIPDIIISQTGFALVGIFGIGALSRRDLPALCKRLGLTALPKGWLWLTIKWIFLLVFMQAIMGGVWAVMSPEEAETVSSLNEVLLGEIDTVWEWFLLAVAAGVGEEILFRGALQPIFGVALTAVIFALVHVQYGFTPILIVIFLLALVFGILRNRYNTSLTILIHFGYDFVLGLLSLAAPHLLEWAESQAHILYILDKYW